MCSSRALLSVLCGRVQPGPRASTAIHKTPTDGAVLLTKLGLVGDEQADKKNHGGPDKAIHHYPLDHYPSWRSRLPGRTVLEQAGAFGENLSTLGLTETNVCLGDVFAVGGAVLQVSQGRQPCWKLNSRFDHKKMAREVQQTGHTGWYYRVLEAGTIERGDDLVHKGRPHPEWPLERLASVIYTKSRDPEDLRAMAGLDLLAESWRTLAQKRLRSGRIECWDSRLNGHR